MFTLYRVTFMAPRKVIRNGFFLLFRGGRTQQKYNALLPIFVKAGSTQTPDNVRQQTIHFTCFRMGAPTRQNRRSNETCHEKNNYMVR